MNYGAQVALRTFEKESWFLMVFTTRGDYTAVIKQRNGRIKYLRGTGAESDFAHISPDRDRRDTYAKTAKRDTGYLSFLIDITGLSIRAAEMHFSSALWAHHNAPRRGGIKRYNNSPPDCARYAFLSAL